MNYLWFNVLLLRKTKIKKQITSLHDEKNSYMLKRDSLFIKLDSLFLKGESPFIIKDKIIIHILTDTELQLHTCGELISMLATEHRKMMTLSSDRLDNINDE